MRTKSAGISCAVTILIAAVCLFAGEIRIGEIAKDAHIRISYPDDFTNKLDIFRCTDLGKGDWSVAQTTNADEIIHATEWFDPDSATSSVGFYVVGNADHDADGDGLPSAREKYIYRTDMDNPDTDGDSLNDGDEVLRYGTSPISSDTDSDGMPDGWEIACGLNPLLDDAAADPDADWLVNLEEYQLAGLPGMADTDGDGLSDGVEQDRYRQGLDQTWRNYHGFQSAFGNCILWKA